MKKTLSLVLALMLALSLVACGNQTNPLPQDLSQKKFKVLPFPNSLSPSTVSPLIRLQWQLIRCTLCKQPALTAQAPSPQQHISALQ